jgi:hypothetical protein
MSTIRTSHAPNNATKDKTMRRIVRQTERRCGAGAGACIPVAGGTPAPQLFGLDVVDGSMNSFSSTH